MDASMRASGSTRVQKSVGGSRSLCCMQGAINVALASNTRRKRMRRGRVGHTARLSTTTLQAKRGAQLSWRHQQDALEEQEAAARVEGGCGGETRQVAHWPTLHTRSGADETSEVGRSGVDWGGHAATTKTQLQYWMEAK